MDFQFQNKIFNGFPNLEIGIFNGFPVREIVKILIGNPECNGPYWPLRDETRSASAIQFPPPPTTTMVPNMRGLVIVVTRSGLVFEQLVYG